MHVLDEPYAVGVIVRISEASVRPGMLSAFRAAVLDEVRTYPSVHAGLERFAGPDWRNAPVTFDGEDDYLLEPLRVRHFIAEPAR